MPSDPRVDAYVAKARPFAQPILKKIRAAVHAGCPKIEETIKWSFPSFYYKGPICGMAAFKAHATLGFWKGALLKRHLPKVDKNAMGHFGALKSPGDLPSRATLVRLVKAAAKLNDDGVKVVRQRKAKPPLKIPAYFTAALRKSPKALAAFRAFPPSHKREYVEWIGEAKREDTRAARIAKAIEWIAQGKSRNWKYE